MRERLTLSQRKALPKSRLFWARRIGVRMNGKRFSRFRNANAMFVWVGQWEIGWRMPWLPRPARALHPELFNRQPLSPPTKGGE